MSVTIVTLVIIVIHLIFGVNEMPLLIKASLLSYPKHKRPWRKWLPKDKVYFKPVWKEKALNGMDDVSFIFRFYQVVIIM